MTPLRLRIDVCTYRGLRDGVSGVLDVLKRTRSLATFFVTFGPDASGRALLKMFNPSFAWKMLRTKAASSYGWATAFYGTLLPSPLVGAGLPDVLKRIRDEGHEVGMHGWDHRRWQDRLPTFARPRLCGEFARMREAYERILGVRPAAFAAPAWLVTGDLLQLEEEARLAYASDARGVRPFLPTWGGHAFTVPQLPVTLPTLDESLGRLSREQFVEATLAAVAAQPEYCCFTAHAETEGRMYRAELEAILSRVERPTRPLGEVPRVDLPRVAMNLGRIEGRPYNVCVQSG